MPDTGAPTSLFQTPVAIATTFHVSQGQIGMQTGTYATTRFILFIHSGITNGRSKRISDNHVDIVTCEGDQKRHQIVNLGTAEAEGSYQGIEILVRETGIEESQAWRLVKLAGALRALKGHDLEEAASTRLLVYAATLIRSGMDERDACRAALAEPLTDDTETIAALAEVIDASLG